jgi:hypothetical protein
VEQSLSPPPKPTPPATVASEQHIAGPAHTPPSTTRSPAETGPVRIESLAAGAHNRRVPARSTLDNPAGSGAHAPHPSHAHYMDSALGSQSSTSVRFPTSGHLRGDQTNTFAPLQPATIPLSQSNSASATAVTHASSTAATAAVQDSGQPYENVNVSKKIPGTYGVSTRL